MKIPSIVHLLLPLLTFLASCRPPTADRRPLKFVAYENNPILGPRERGYVIPSSILKKEDGTFMLYYTAAAEFTDRPASYIGLATSADGINWIKYNDPATTDHPFADSDPVLINTKNSKPYNDFPWNAFVLKTSQEYEMYFSYLNDMAGIRISEIGYATSLDGIHWKKYPGNPVYGSKDDPYTATNKVCRVFEFPTLVYTDSLCFMYYDYGQITNSIGVATAVLNE